MILPSTNLSNNQYCYRALFSKAALEEAPKLPATILSKGCYWYMFEECYIWKAPELPALTVPQEGYGHIFTGCSSLSYVKCLATSINAYKAIEGWMANVPTSYKGTFIKNSSMSGWSRGTDGIPTNWLIFNDVDPNLAFTATGNSIIGLSSVGSNQIVYYSKDNNHWKWTQSTTSTTISLTDGQKVYICGDLSANNGVNDYTQFTMSGSLAGEGNIGYVWSLSTPNSSLRNYCGYHLFDGCTSLTKAPELTPTTLANYCYQRMFEDCSGLTESPILPASTIETGSYREMFQNCSNMTKITCLATDGIKTAGMFANTTSWVDGVAASGTFYCDSSQTSVWEPSANSGSPSGWTVTAYSA